MNNYNREAAEHIIKRSTKARLVDILAAALDGRRVEAEHAQVACAERDKMRARLSEYMAIEQAVEVVHERRKDGDTDLESVLSDILDNCAEIVNACDAYNEDGLAEREKMLRALGMDEHDWRRTSWRY